jgi:hypothetical protein
MKLLMSLLFTAVLSGCATQWVRPNTPPAEAAQDVAQCGRDAMAKFPVSQIAVSHDHWTNPETKCDTTPDGQTHCDTKPPEWKTEPDTWEDQNEGPRGQYQSQCLMTKGYTLQRVK